MEPTKNEQAKVVITKANTALKKAKKKNNTATKNRPFEEKFTPEEMSQHSENQLIFTASSPSNSRVIRAQSSTERQAVYRKVEAILSCINIDCQMINLSKP